MKWRQAYLPMPAPKCPARPPIARIVPPEGSALCWSAPGVWYLRHDWNARGICKRCTEPLNKP